MGLKWLWFCLVSAAAFFVTYECTKSLLGAGPCSHMAPATHMLAASLGEIVSISVCRSPNFCLLLFVCKLLFCSLRTVFLSQSILGKPAVLHLLLLFYASALPLLFLSHHYNSQMNTTGMSVNINAFQIAQTTIQEGSRGRGMRFWLWALVCSWLSYGGFLWPIPAFPLDQLDK